MQEHHRNTPGIALFDVRQFDSHCVPPRPRQSDVRAMRHQPLGGRRSPTPSTSWKRPRRREMGKDAGDRAGISAACRTLSRDWGLGTRGLFLGASLPVAVPSLVPSPRSPVQRGLDSELSHPRPDRRAVDAEQLGRALGAGEDAAGLSPARAGCAAAPFPRACNVSAPRRRGSTSARCSSSTVALAQDDRPFEHVGQLADVARPGVDWSGARGRADRSARRAGPCARRTRGRSAAPAAGCPPRRSRSGGTSIGKMFSR